MKVLVVYYSETSHTGKVAESIHEEASKDHETARADEFSKYEFLI